MLDVLILGGGFAGIAAALKFQAAGLDYEIIEARDRLGGRVFAAPTTDIELGAEFVHGRPPATLRFLDEARIRLKEVPDSHLFLGPSGLREEPRFWENLETVMGHLREDLPQDRSFDEFLASLRGSGVSREARAMARAFVEGFNASEADAVSEKHLAQSWKGFKSSDEMRAFHPQGGYSRLVKAAGKRIPFYRVMLETRARKLRWQERSVAVEAESVVDGSVIHLQARCVVITLPVGVLKAPAHVEGAVEILPAVPELKAALEGVRMGSVVKAVLCFQGLPESVERKWSEISFVHQEAQGRGPSFQTWWTETRGERRLLTNWATGEPARILAAGFRSDMLKAALHSASRIFGSPVEALRSCLVSWHFHDWDSDPYSRGAYGFVVQGGVDLQRRLSQPFGGGLIRLAGEACAQRSEPGTVEAAIESGESVAEQIIGALRYTRAA